MGNDRGKCEDKPPIEVFRTIKSYWEADEQELYRLWLAYNNRLVINKDPRKTVSQLLRRPDFYPPETLNYFMAMGFEMFNREYLKGIENGEI